MRSPLPRSGAAPLLATGMFVVACGGTTTLDQEQVSALIVEAVEEGIGLTPTDIECPEVEDPEQGTTFQCTATIDAQTLRIDGEILDVDEGTVSVANADAVLFVDLLETSIADDFGQQLDVVLTVDCGDTEVRVEEVGAEFECTATDEFGEEAAVFVEVQDLEGNVTYELR